MHKPFLYVWLCLLISIISGCQTPYQRIEEKNKCFTEKLKALKSTNLYKNVLSQFRDTFAILKDRKDYFGIPSIVENRIDDAVFFNTDSTQCLLIVLQRDRDTLYLFGLARIINGINDNGHWKFTVGMQYDFEKEFFNDYPQNSFENIAKLARYGVLVNANANKEGCEINDKYWFSNEH